MYLMPSITLVAWALHSPQHSLSLTSTLVSYNWVPDTLRVMSTSACCSPCSGRMKCSICGASQSDTGTPLCGSLGTTSTSSTSPHKVLLESVYMDYMILCHLAVFCPDIYWRQYFFHHLSFPFCVQFTSCTT